MRLKHLNGLILISYLINSSAAAYYHSTNQFYNNNIYPKQLPSSSNWIQTDNYNQHQQQECENSYLPSTYTPKNHATNVNSKEYENYISDITLYGQSPRQIPLITNNQKNQELLLKSTSYGNHQEQQQQRPQSLIYSTENVYPYYSTNKNEQQPTESSSFHKLSPAITLISEQHQQPNHQDYMKTESLVGKMPTKSIISLSKLPSGQNTGYGSGINGYNYGTSEQYPQNINNFQQQPSNYQQLNDRQKSNENIHFLPLYENNDNSYHQQSQLPYINSNNYDTIKLKNLLQQYTNYMENQLQNHKKFEESKNQQENLLTSNYHQYINTRNNILPNSASINTSHDIPSGRNLIASQEQKYVNHDVSAPTKTVYYQPHEIILTTSLPPPSLSALSRPDEIHYPKINYYHQPTAIGHSSYQNTDNKILQNYNSDKIKSIGQSSAGAVYQAAVAAFSLQSGSAVPISKHVQVTKHIPIPIYNQIHIPIKHPVKINISQPVITTVPKPYQIQIPITKPIVVPIVKEVKLTLDKIVPYPVEKRIPYMVEKHIPYSVEKYIRVPIVKPYPVRVPIFKTILHKSKVHNNNYFGDWPF